MAAPVSARPFHFESDTIAYPNELVWEYAFDPEGEWVGRRREPPPDYARRCFVLVRSARQFFGRARFDPGRPPADEETYRRLVRRVVDASPEEVAPEAERIVIPGYASLREFSAAHEALLKREAGGFWDSYLQRGNWRMILPFTRRHQAGMAERLVTAIDRNEPPVVHVVRFPDLTINHAVLLFAYRETEDAILFDSYDPNDPSAPVVVTFDRGGRTFLFPELDYFPGGPVDVYHVYRSPLY